VPCKKGALPRIERNVRASILHGVVERAPIAASAPAETTIEALFAAHVRFVWRSLRHFGVAAEDLDDLTQEVFLVAHRRLAEWDGSAPRGWLCAIARRCAAASRRRSHRRHERTVETVPEGCDTRDPSARVELDLLSRILDTLDETERVAFVLHEIEEMPMREVAEVLQCPLYTAYRRYHAARRELTRLLERET
jgi:RNA polymerase sigma-70 factor, ECF subfamily